MNSIKISVMKPADASVVGTGSVVETRSFVEAQWFLAGTAMFPKERQFASATSANPVPAFDGARDGIEVSAHSAARASDYALRPNQAPCLSVHRSSYLGAIPR